MQAVEKYRRIAETYDRRTSFVQRYRAATVRELGLSRGDTVIDVGCGTGLNFPLLEERIGPAGRLIGVDLSPDMLREAQSRSDHQGWRNVTLVQSSVQDAKIDAAADAALFFLTHDITRSPNALANVSSHLKPSGRLAVFGMKWLPPRWLAPANLIMWNLARPYITTFEGYSRPWTRLAQIVPDLRVRSVLLGAAYIACGNAPEHDDVHRNGGEP